MGDRHRSAKGERSASLMRQTIGLPNDDGRAEAALAMMRRRAQRGNPEAALHILNHVVPDIPPDEDDQE